MLLPLLAGILLGRPQFDFYSDGPYDSSIPRPESILRYGPGERHSTFREQESVVLQIAAKAKDRVKVIEYGRTPEGRPLRVFVIGSPKNMARLEEIRQEHADLAAGKGDPAKTLPIVWINECIHGDETASFEAGMWTMYNLVASRGGRIAKALDQELVILNPVYNPDGHERYVVYYNSIAVGSPDPSAFEEIEPRTISGRLNHYRFDMNRDRIAFSQDETREEFAEMLRWNPQVYIDQHGQVASYFFPPEPMSINTNVDRVRNAKWTDIFGRATAKAFDEHGFSYFVKDTFDLYYPGYIDSSNTLTGAIGMTHETDGGRLLATKRDDGSILTLRQGIEKHFTSALAVVSAAADHAADLLSSYAEFKKRAVSGASAGKTQRIVLTATDPRPLRRLQTQLAFAGIHSSFAKEAFTQPDATDYWTGKRSAQLFQAGALVVDLAQSQGAFAKALLEPGQDFEPEFIKDQVSKKKSVPDGETYPGAAGADFYDLTGWSLPFAHDLDAWTCESATKVPAEADVVLPIQMPPHSSVGYAVPYRDQDDLLGVCDAMGQGVRAQVANDDMDLDGKHYARGTFLFLADRNDEGFEEKLFSAVHARGGLVTPLSTGYPDAGGSTGPGSEGTGSLRPPKIGIVFGASDRLADVGAIWYLMDRVFKLPYTPLRSESLSGNLADYTTIVVPRGVSVSLSGKLRDWVDAGGSLVALDGGAYAGPGGVVSLDTVTPEPQELPGTLFRAEIDPRSFLSYGYPVPNDGPVRLAVCLQGRTFYKTRKEGGSMVKISSEDTPSKLLSGWEWPDETEKAIRGTVLVQDVPMGRGHAILFMQDPTERAMWPGLYKLLLNAMILGPS